MCLFSLTGVAADIPIASPIFPAPDLGCLASPTVQRTGCFQFASCLLGERRGKAFEKCKVEAPVVFYPPIPPSSQPAGQNTEYKARYCGSKSNERGKGVQDLPGGDSAAYPRPGPLDTEPL